jgi:hypothetical protein
MTGKAIVACTAPLLALALVGCGPGQPRTSTATPEWVATSISSVPSAEKLSTAVAAGVDSACEQTPISAKQLAGAWVEPGGTTVTTLGDDFALTSSAAHWSGSWSYLRWASSPGISSMPPGEEAQCVLWLHWQTPAPAMDLVYVPLKASDTSVELSFVGRGNTITWVRPAQSS